MLRAVSFCRLTVSKSPTMMTYSKGCFIVQIISINCKCEKLGPLFYDLAAKKRFKNCFCKNLLKQLNDSAVSAEIVNVEFVNSVVEMLKVWLISN